MQHARRFSFDPRLFPIPLWLALVLASLVGIQPTRAAEVFPRGSQWKLFKGRSAPAATAPGDWRLAGFNDSAWITSGAPFRYGDNASGGTELADMRGNYSSLYLRKKFEVTNPGQVRDIDLGVAVDDGFIAWINGVEVARYNVPDGPAPFNGLAVGAVAEPVPFETFRVENLNGLLVTGTNILTIHAFNVSLAGSSDFYFDASLSVDLDSTPPAVADVFPEPGSILRELDYIEVDFTERVLGLEASDLLINGVPAEAVVEEGPGQFVFTFPEPPDGRITVAWKTGHGITDRAGSPHPFAGGTWSYQLTVGDIAPGINISEFMADNDRTLNDEDGESSDWIEIHNPSADAADLTGWFLTDDAASPTKWKFPAISIPARGYLVVFASEKNRTNPVSRLHTNFKLAPGGEYLALVSPATNVVSSFAPVYPPQVRDVSYGRVPGTSSEGFFSRPSPGSENSTGGPGFATEVGFSRTSSTFFSPFELRLSSPNTNAVIRYTLNGSAPTNSSTVYTGPILLTNSTQVRARVYAPGLLPGPVRSEGYVFLTNTLANFTSDLPVILIHTMGQGTPSASRQTPVQFSVFEPVNGITSLTNRPTLATRAAVKVRGSSTEGLAKSSYALEFWDELNIDADVSLLGMPAAADWVLYAPNNFEPSLIHNPFMHTLSKDIGRYSPRTRFAEVYVTAGTTGVVTEARYNGIYVVEERIRIGRDRVNIDKLKPENLQPPEVTGGFLLKVDRLDPGDTGFSGAGVAMAYVDPKEREIKLATRVPQRNYLSNYFRNFGLALNDRTNWLHPELGYRPYIDAGSWVDFHLLNTLSANPDGFSLSTYLHKPRNGPITYGPIWDFDRTLGSTDGRDANPRLWGGGGSSHFFTFGWWLRVFRDPDFFQAYIDRYQELRRGEFSTPALQARVERLGNEVRQAHPRERARWRVFPRGGSYQAELNRMKSWLSNRVDFIDQQFVRPPVLGRPGGNIPPGYLLTLTASTNATILYTLDGSDPRSPQGAPASKALTYTGPVRLESNARIFARARDFTHRPRTNGDAPPLSSPWSGPVIATFTVTPFPLAITELMFHPAAAPAGSPFVTDDFQFVELRNTGSIPLALAGIRFSSPFDFVFSPNAPTLAPGARTLLVRNRAAFLSRHPGVTNISGEFNAPMPHNNGRITITGPLLEPILDFVYQDSWNPLADGFGFSLVPADESATAANLNLNEPAAWRLSARQTGSPGVADPNPVRPLPVLINEAMASTALPQQDLIELYNPGSIPVDISSWYLTDDYRTPRKFRIPSGTIIAANGLLTFTASEWQRNGAASFGLSADGDELYIFSANSAGDLTGWVHGFRYGASPLGSSFGRHQVSDGTERFVLQSRPSPGTANIGPQVGPLVISEIMFHPPDAGIINNTLDEYLELRNISQEPVLLFSPSRPSSTWRIRGDVNFDFPPNRIVSPAGFVVIVSFDPEVEVGRLAAFRARYGLSPETPVFGPWSGQLNNAGGTLRLERPDAAGPSPSAESSNILVESITFSPHAPWPTDASGTGRSLLRRDPRLFGDDPAAWTSALPVPGDTDVDSDGLPDTWEIAAGLDPANSNGADGAAGDPDADGLTNVEELQAGTQPKNPASLLSIQAATWTTNQVFLSFRTLPGRSYTVMYRDGFTTNASWIRLRSLLGISGNDSAIVTDNLTNTVRYYRLQTP